MSIQARASNELGRASHMDKIRTPGAPTHGRLGEAGIASAGQRLIGLAALPGLR